MVLVKPNYVEQYNKVSLYRHITTEKLEGYSQSLPHGKKVLCTVYNTLIK